MLSTDPVGWPHGAHVGPASRVQHVQAGPDPGLSLALGRLAAGASGLAAGVAGRARCGGVARPAAGRARGRSGEAAELFQCLPTARQDWLGSRGGTLCSAVVEDTHTSSPHRAAKPRLRAWGRRRVTVCPLQASSRALLAASTCLEALLAALTLLSTPGLPPALYGEEWLARALAALRFHLEVGEEP